MHGASEYLELHTQTESCCRQCMGLGLGICGSLGCKSSCPHFDHGEHDDGDCKCNKQQVSNLLHWAEIQNNAAFE